MRVSHPGLWGLCRCPERRGTRRLLYSRSYDVAGLFRSCFCRCFVRFVAFVAGRDAPNKAAGLRAPPASASLPLGWGGCCGEGGAAPLRPARVVRVTSRGPAPPLAAAEWRPEAGRWAPPWRRRLWRAPCGRPWRDPHPGRRRWERCGTRWRRRGGARPPWGRASGSGSGPCCAAWRPPR